MWQHRNTEEHKNDHEIIREQTLQVIHQEIQLGTQNFITLKPYFTPEETSNVLAGNLGYMRAWIRIVQAIRKRELQKEDERQEEELDR
jgi:hypothetical protein